MAKQKPDLSTALADIGGSTRKARKPADRPRPKIDRPQSRAVTFAITAHFPKQVRDQLKILAVTQDVTMQELSAEAYNDLFAKYGKPEIAPTPSK